MTIREIGGIRGFRRPIETVGNITVPHSVSRNADLIAVRAPHPTQPAGVSDAGAAGLDAEEQTPASLRFFFVRLNARERERFYDCVFVCVYVCERGCERAPPRLRSGRVPGGPGARKREATNCATQFRNANDVQMWLLLLLPFGWRFIDVMGVGWLGCNGVDTADVIIVRVQLTTRFVPKLNPSHNVIIWLGFCE